MNSPAPWIMTCVMIGLAAYWLLISENSKKSADLSDSSTASTPNPPRAADSTLPSAAPTRPSQKPPHSQPAGNANHGLPDAPTGPPSAPQQRPINPDSIPVSTPDVAAFPAKPTAKLTTHASGTRPAASDSFGMDDDGDPVREMVWSADKTGIQAAMKEVTAQIQECYDGWIQSNPDMQGKVLVRFTIGAEPGDQEARVLEVELPESELDNPVMEGCVLNVVSGLRFNPPDGGKLVVNYPFRFSTQMP